MAWSIEHIYIALKPSRGYAVAGSNHASLIKYAGITAAGNLLYPPPWRTAKRFCPVGEISTRPRATLLSFRFMGLQNINKFKHVMKENYKSIHYSVRWKIVFGILSKNVMVEFLLSEAFNLYVINKSNLWFGQ